MVLGAAGRQHRQIALGEPRLGLFVDRIERVHQAVAERVRVDVERRMNEMGNVNPEGLVAGPKLDRRTEALGLYLEPDLAQSLRGELALAAFAMHPALERVERDLSGH